MPPSLHNLLRAAGTVGIDFEISEIGPEKPVKKKDGGTWQACTVVMKLRDSGDIFTKEFPPFQVETMIKGGLIRGVYGEPYDTFTILPVGERSSQVKSASNQQQINAERAVSDAKEQYEYAEKARNTSIILQAFAKSWIESGIAKTPADACRLARETYDIHKYDVAEILAL